MTFAFIGEPVFGDRPDRKHTPFAVSLLSADLLSVAMCTLAGHSRPKEAMAHYIAQPVEKTVQTTLEHIVALEECLFGAINDGDWSVFGGSEQSPLAKVPSVVTNDR